MTLPWQVQPRITTRENDRSRKTLSGVEAAETAESVAQEEAGSAMDETAGVTQTSGRKTLTAIPSPLTTVEA
jgi:hypothetical protein